MGLSQNGNQKQIHKHDKAIKTGGSRQSTSESKDDERTNGLPDRQEHKQRHK